MTNILDDRVWKRRYKAIAWLWGSGYSAKQIGAKIGVTSGQIANWVMKGKKDAEPIILKAVRKRESRLRNLRKMRKVQKRYSGPRLLGSDTDGYRISAEWKEYSGKTLDESSNLNRRWMLENGFKLNRLPKKKKVIVRAQ